MLNKIIWTKTSKFKDFDQFRFELPAGYYIHSAEDIEIKYLEQAVINLGVSIYSEEPITLFFTKTIWNNSVFITDPVQIIVPKKATDLYLNIISLNPHKDFKKWTLAKGSFIATMVPFNTSFTNLFEVNNKMFEQYE